MASPRKDSHLRYRYGKCLTETCSKCKTREVQQISVRGDFVCPECGKPLHECPPPKKKSKAPLYAIGGVGAAALIGVAVFSLLPGKSENAPEPEPVPVDSVEVVTGGPDTIAGEVDTVVAEPKGPQVETGGKNGGKNGGGIKGPEPAPQNGYGTITLPYGKYTGDLKNGKPHGHGTITYTRSQQIVPSKDFVANPGDTYEGEFRDGRISGGTGLWSHDGDVTGIRP